MLKLGLAAVGAAAALAVAGHAGAAVMTASLNGSFDPLRLGPNHQFIGGGWDANLTYDTSFGTQSNVGGEQMLTWTSASGGASPLTGGTLTAFGFDGTSYNYALDNLTAFSLTRSTHGTIFSFTTAGISFVATNYRFGQTPDLGADLSLTAAYEYSTFQSGLNPVSSMISTNDFNGSAYTDMIRITAAPVPEPGTWALLIVGFGAVGAAARHRRRHTVSAALA